MFDVVVKDAPDLFLFGPTSDVDYAKGRRPERTYVSKTFPLRLSNSRDYGQPTRYVWKVFDGPEEPEDVSGLPDVEREEYVVDTKARTQIKLQVTRQAGNIRCIEIQRVPTDPDATNMQTLAVLDREAAARLMLLARTLDTIPVHGVNGSIRIEDELLQYIFSNPDAMTEVYDRFYDRAPGRFRELIENDPTSTDVIALARRKEAVEYFHNLLEDDAFFDAERAKVRGPEAVWQRFLEANPWILGIGLSGQLLTSWNATKLEQVVAGSSITGPGKRTDALLRTSGNIRSLVYAEIKHHMTDLVCAKPYRPGCWAPSEELVGAVTQVQQTLELARREIGHALRDRAPDGSYTGEETYMLRPRSFLILGALDQLRGGGGGVHPEQFSSFELYRRNLYEPEIITFDELLARAEWHVTLAEGERAAY